MSHLLLVFHCAPKHTVQKCGSHLEGESFYVKRASPEFVCVSMMEGLGKRREERREKREERREKKEERREKREERREKR